MMRTILISLAAAASALAVASPASAQWAQWAAPPQPYGYGSQHYGAPAYGTPGYGMPGYGYGHNQHSVRNLKLRIDSLQRQIRVLARRNILSNPEARRLRAQSVAIEHRLVHAGRHGLNRREARDIETRIARLEYRMQRQAMNRNGRWGRQAGQYRGDRRWERQHDRWHDRHED